MSEDLVINYASDILVKVRHNQEVYVELSLQGPQGPQGEKGEHGELTPELAQARDDAIAAAVVAESAKTDAETARTGAENAQTAAADSATAADTSATAAASAKSGADTAKTAAETARDAAQTSQTAAATSATNAAGSATFADEVADDVVAALTAAETARDMSVQAKTDSQTARDASVAAKTASETARDSATASKDAAATSATDADASKTAAATSAADADASEANALASKNAAALSATAAADSETNADLAKLSAQGSATAALGSKNAAELAQTAAELARDDAIAAEVAAAASETAALSSETAAEGSAIAAAVSAAAAADSAASIEPSSLQVRAEKNQPGGYSGLGPDGKLDINQLPPLGGLAGKETVSTIDIDDKAVTLAKQADVATAVLMGRVSAGTGNQEALTPAQVRFLLALEQTNNTSDADKPISTAQAAVNALKAPLASPEFTGVPTAPTAALGTSTTQIASTAFVRSEVQSIVGAAPEALNTLQEIAAQLASDSNALAAITTSLSGKMSKSANLSDMTDYDAAWTNLGLGTAAAMNWEDFALSSHVHAAATATVNGFMTGAQFTKLAGIEALADQTDLTNVQAALTSKAAVAPIDAHELYSSAGKFTWATLKSTLKTYFDTIYQTAAAVAAQIATATGGDMTGNAYPRNSVGTKMNFVFSGQTGQPSWLWGTTDGANMLVWNPANFNVTSVGGQTYAQIAATIEARAKAWGYDSVPTAVAIMRAGGLGCYALMTSDTSLTVNQGIAGASVHWANATGFNQGNGGSGSYVCLGDASGSSAPGRTTVFLRYA
jgi:hypothetical protein